MAEEGNYNLVFLNRGSPRNMHEQAKPSCFVIAPIGERESETRKRSDKVLKHIFRKALAQEYEVRRADEIEEPGMITSQVLREVQESELVVADLTGHNPNVLYELAVRHAIEKPIIHVIEPKHSKIPFDIYDFRTIEFDLSDPDSIENAVEDLRKQAQQARNGKWGETPIKLANIMRRSKDDAEDTLLLKTAVQAISTLQANIGEMRSTMMDLITSQSWSPLRRALSGIDSGGGPSPVLIEPPANPADLPAHLRPVGPNPSKRNMPKF